MTNQRVWAVSKLDVEGVLFLCDTAETVKRNLLLSFDMDEDEIEDFDKKAYIKRLNKWDMKSRIDIYEYSVYTLPILDD